jgi:hypothetical protein
MTNRSQSTRSPALVATGDSAERVSTIASATPRLRLDGPCLRDTRERLEAGTAGAKALTRAEVDNVTGQAGRLLGEIVLAYAQNVATGEVGADGSGRASAARPIAGECPTGLLYGLIQSGKTAAMILTTAMAIDNGFRVIVVLTSRSIKLMDQTAERFAGLEGPLVYSSTSAIGGQYEWQADRGNIERRIGSLGVVFVCAKEARHQRALIGFLREIGAANYPAIILDDEADYATPDTTLAARSAQRPTAPAQASTTYRLTVENDAPAEPGESFRELLRHNVFAQVTATPYGLLLQRAGSPLRPEFTVLIDPGEDYCGGEMFFEHVEVDAAPPLAYVDDHEAQVLQRGAAAAPEGLARSVAFFLLAASTHARSAGSWPAKGYKHLSHTSPNTAAHDHVADLIRSYADALGDALATDRPSVAQRPEFAWAYEELRKTCRDAPPLEVLLEDIDRRIPRRKILTINAQGSAAPYGPYFNFMVGGNILGRGLTIDELLVTYYLRQAQTTQMDTMLQHARMYGYRMSLMAYTRVFLPYHLALRFQVIHQSERSLRDILFDGDSGTPIPIAVINNLRPTRPGILDAGALGTYRPGQQVYPIEPVYEAELLGDSTRRIDEKLRGAFGGLVRRNEWLEVPIDVLVDLIRVVPVREDDPSDWDTATIEQVLTSISDRYNGRGRLYIRNFERERRVLVTGGISGAEFDAARQARMPVLFLLHETGTRPSGTKNPWSGVPFWYPTVVFPPSMPNQVFNASR